MQHRSQGFSAAGAVPGRRPVGLLLAVLASGPVLRGQTYTYKSRIDHAIVRYKMAARFGPATKAIKGRYTLSWWNHTEDRVADLYFHLYLNAFKNADSSFMQAQAVRRRPEELE